MLLSDIRIEWQKNFEPFDMAIFNNAMGARWIDDWSVKEHCMPYVLPQNERRGINASNLSEMDEYLSVVNRICQVNRMHRDSRTGKK